MHAQTVLDAPLSAPLLGPRVAIERAEPLAPNRTAAARRAFLDRFVEVADPDHVLPDEERERLGRELLRQHLVACGRRSGAVRRGRQAELIQLRRQFDQLGQRLQRLEAAAAARTSSSRTGPRSVSEEPALSAPLRPRESR